MFGKEIARMKFVKRTAAQISRIFFFIVLRVRIWNINKKHNFMIFIFSYFCCFFVLVYLGRQ